MTICVITFCVGKLLHFALIILLHFVLVLHFAAIVITFCVSITLCGDYYILRRNKDNKESLLKQKNSLSIKPKKTEKKAVAAKTTKMAKEDTCTGQKIKKGKGTENKQKKGKELKDKGQTRKGKKRQLLSTRVENLLEKMTNESVDDRFSSGLIDQCCQILSIPFASGSEDSDIDKGQHQDAAEDPETPLSVRPQAQYSSQQPSLSQSRNKQSTLVLPVLVIKDQGLWTVIQKQNCI